MKGVIQPDHIPLNKFTLLVLGQPDFTFISLAGLEEELNIVNLPDRTVASGGRTNPVQFTVMLPDHHLVEQAAMELWFQESKDPVVPSYKKVGTLLLPSISDEVIRSFSLVDLFPSKRVIADREFDNDGEMAAIEWTLNASDILPL